MPALGPVSSFSVTALPPSLSPTPYIESSLLFEIDAELQNFLLTLYENKKRRLVIAVRIDAIPLQ
jgi:hypothetical protein